MLRRVLPNPLTVPSRLGGALRSARPLWSRDGLALIAVRGLAGPGADDVASATAERLLAVPGVEWADVQPCTGRAGIAFDPELTDVTVLVEVVADTERETGVDREPFSAQAHPADDGPLHRAALGLVADVAGLGLGAFSRIARLSPVPVELSALLSFADNTPRLRRVVEARVGKAPADVAFILGNAVAQGLSQGAAPLLLDAGHRVSQVTETTARRRAWDLQAPRLLSAPPAARASSLVTPPARPVPLAKGPVERYADQAALASTAAAAMVGVLARDRRQAATAVIAGLPKAATLGREAFAAQLGRLLAARGVVALDSDALRRLDRIDVVVVDPAALVRTDVVDAVSFGGTDVAEVRTLASSLWTAAPDPDGIRRQDGIALGPVDGVDLPLPRGGKTRLRELRRGRRQVQALARDDEVVGLVVFAQGEDPHAAALVAALEQCEARVVRAHDAETVRSAQREGAGVAVIGTAAAGEALAAADCGIGIVRHQPPWSADLLCFDLDDAAFVVECLDVARHVSARGVRLAMAGSGLGAFAGLVGPRRFAPARVSLLVNGAGATAMAAGAWQATARAQRFRPVRSDTTAWHELTPAEALRQLDVTTRGLSAPDAVRRAPAHREDVGWAPRVLGPLVEEFDNPLTPALALGAGLSAAVGSSVDAAIVVGLIGINSVTGAVQRIRADRGIGRLLDATATVVKVRREGEEHAVPGSQLAPGDVVLYEAGDVVAGDARLLDAQGLEVDESTLTGESIPVAKRPDPASGALADRHCMLYDGTTVSAGRATAVVVAVGDATEAAVGLAAADAPPVTGVEQRLAELTRRTLPVALAAGAAVTLTGLVQRWPLRDVVGSGVSLAVASVPEGLPFVANLAQLGAARRLADHGVLVRNPKAVEALGRVDVLCFDKTGTLTRGRIELRAVSDGLDLADVTELDRRLEAVLRAALRANPVADDTAANETDIAVANGATAAGVVPGPRWRRVAELPFDPSRGFHAVLGDDDGARRLFAKGAPEVVLPRCVAWRRDGERMELDDESRRGLVAEARRIAATGARVLAVAQRGASRRSDLDEGRLHDLEFLGFLAFSEQIRESARSAVGDVRAAGVRVIMITGDHPSTAEWVARQLGILDGGRVMTGLELDDVPDEKLPAVLDEVTVFARVAPAQKVRIVAGLQASGRAVAMTGDGANDAPSIRLADCGIAVGRRSAAAARDAADIVVTSDRLETITTAILEGRAMWGSVRDALAILVGGNLGEIGFSVVGSLLGRGPALNARQLLLVNLMTDLAPAMAIALRPPPTATGEAAVRLMREGPDRSLGSRLNQEIAVRAVVGTAAASGAYLAARGTGSAGRARTTALVALVGTQLGQTMLSADGSRLVKVTSVASWGLLAAVVQTPGLSTFFGCRPLGPVAWATATSAAVLGTGASAAASRALVRAAESA